MVFYYIQILENLSLFFQNLELVNCKMIKTVETKFDAFLLMRLKES